MLLVKTHGLGHAMPHFLTQKSFTKGKLLGLAILWWLVNLLENPNDDSDDTIMDTDASRCLWALRPPPQRDQSSLYPLACPLELHMGCIV